MKKLNKDGFSLVELLAVIVILGIITSIGIYSVSLLVNKAKRSEMDSHKSTVVMTTQTYLQANKNLVPKVIGESKNIKISELKTSNYLTKEIKNSAGESCMENSYVRVYKLSNTEYTYTPYIYCGDEEVPEVEEVPSPIVTAKFTDSTGAATSKELNNVSDAYLFIEVSAASDADLQTYKNMKTPINLDGYSFKIYVVNNGIRKEAYNSGSLSAGREEKLLINKKLQEYIDVTGITEVSLEVTVINTLGGITSTNTSVVDNTEKEKVQYNDTILPTCIAPDSPYSEDDWLNKEDYARSKEPRKITVGCSDGTGSQCIRSYFTESWPNETSDEAKLGAEYYYIDVKDNAGNVSCSINNGCMILDAAGNAVCNPANTQCTTVDTPCKVRVNVDIQTPKAVVTAYKGGNSSSSESNNLAGKTIGSNVLKKSIEAKDTSTTNSIQPTDEYYNNLVGNETDIKWLNKENYPDGIIYKIDLTDNLRLDKWTWQTNAGHITSYVDENYKNVNGTNPEATYGEIDQTAANNKTNLHGSTTGVVYVRFLTEGMRYGVFKAYDKAGNSIEITIAANLDRTAPPVPENIVAYVYNNVRGEVSYEQ